MIITLAANLPDICSVGISSEQGTSPRNWQEVPNSQGGFAHCASMYLAAAFLKNR